MKVIKRNKQVVDFDKNKIVIAIEKSMIETKKGIDHELALAIADTIEEECLENTSDITIEDIQDKVEEKLIESERFDAGKRYILYRNERAKLRENPKWEMTEIQKAIWENKYRYHNESFKEFLNRVSGNDEEINKLMIQKKFLPAGRILAGRGTWKDGQKVTLSNCFVLPQPEDNLESIFETAKLMARTYSWGGGVGISLDKLRPNKAEVHNAAATTTGPISFMNLYGLTTEIIGQHSRRGALMIAMDCSHPDIIDFINCKTDLGKVNKANISVKITDDFMRAVEKEGDWRLHFTVIDTGEEIEKIVKANDIFNLLCKNNWNYAEPGILFWDRITNWNLLSEDKDFAFSSVNPCAEEPLPDFGSCNLGSLNLSEFVDHAFTDGALFNWGKFDYAVRKAVRYMNSILDESIEHKLYPLPQQLQVVKDWRQIGIGIMGIADMLIKMQIKYGSKTSIDFCDKLGLIMINSALQESALMAKESSTYPLYNKKAILASPFLLANATEETLALIEQYGLRNSQLLTIAPTGSISTMWGVSGGIESIFQISYTRKTETLNDEDTYYEIFTDIAKEYMEKFNLKNKNQLPDYFVTTSNINPYDRLEMQAIWQKHIDASISSTLNLPFMTSVEQVKGFYLQAHELGLKGCTIYRDGCKREGILTKKKIDGEDVEVTDQICPECGANAIVRMGGCSLCTECGYSPCV